ncbi:MAG: dihydropteroate synthase [Clostridiaceae bacterium]|nr:dihydropteroate synthase [Clostridiaceae bacterium]
MHGGERLAQFFKCRGFSLPLGKRTYIMGILNVTPDSFFDGGRYNELEKALEKARELVKNGADIIDIGGESTRPGFIPVSEEEELSRVIPVVEVLTRELDVPISIDTTKSIVAEKALEAGAHIVNDVWGLQKDSNLAGVVSKYDAGVIIMHNKEDTIYVDFMCEIMDFLKKSIEIAVNAGITADHIAVDPGIGFGKTFEHNIEVMRKLDRLKELRLPILLGTSRKSFIGNILNLPVTERLEGTAATVALGIAKGVDIIRVHDVVEMKRVAKVADAIVRGLAEYDK